MKTRLDEIQASIQEEILNPVVLNPEVVAMLNDRIADEYTAHYFYRNASNWCAEKAYKKAAAFFAQEAANELEHSQKVEKYLVDWSVIPILPMVKMAPVFANLIDIVNRAYQLEFDLFQKYNTTSQALFNSDLATFDFLQELRIGQRESVAEYADLLNAAQLVDVSSRFEILYFEQTYF